jgi:hypothetical protein
MDLDWNFTELPAAARTEIKAKEAQVSNDVPGTAMEWARFRGKLLNVLRTFPDAYKAVVEVFAPPEPAT